VLKSAQTLARVIIAVVVVSLPGMAAPIGIQNSDPYPLPTNTLGAEKQIVTGGVAVTASDRIAPATIEPTQTLDMPLSPAMILFGAALAGLLLLGRRRRSTGPGMTD
jgi:hypothetical protein